MKTKALQLNTEKIFWIFASVLFVLFLAYGYLVNTAILHAVARQKTQQQISLLSSQTADLETSYIALKNSVTLDLAYSLGFKNATNAHFITRKNSTGISLNR
jgi:hypothetical protein